MTDFRALCEELADSVELLLEMRQCARPMQITEDRLNRARAALTQPEPQGPTDEELWDLYQDLGRDFSPTEFARTVLARWGTPAIEPVPVSERLPGPADCDAEGLCWWWEPDCEQPEAWCIGLPEYCGSSTHWLPRWALPVPQQEAE
jgi:hypothetical protein